MLLKLLTTSCSVRQLDRSGPGQKPVPKAPSCVAGTMTDKPKTYVKETHGDFVSARLEHDEMGRHSCLNAVNSVLFVISRITSNTNPGMSVFDIKRLVAFYVRCLAMFDDCYFLCNHPTSNEKENEVQKRHNTKNAGAFSGSSQGSMYPCHCAFKHNRILLAAIHR